MLFLFPLAEVFYLSMEKILNRFAYI